MLQDVSLFTNIYANGVHKTATLIDQNKTYTFDLGGYALSANSDHKIDNGELFETLNAAIAA